MRRLTPIRRAFIPELRLCALRHSLLGLAVLVIALTSRASGQVQDLPVMHEELAYHLPVQNGIPAKDDPPLRTDNDIPPDFRDVSEMASTAYEAPAPPALDADESWGETGDPVALHNGMVSYRAVDLVIPGRGIHFELTRRYNSKLSARLDIEGTRLGRGWDHNWNVRLESSAIGLRLNNGNSREDEYAPTGTNVWTGIRGLYTTVKYDPSNSHYILRARNGSKSTFAPVAGSIGFPLLTVEDANGNKLTCNYDTSTAGDPKLASVVDTLGRTIEFFHDSNGRLERVRDFFGREVIYTHDSSGNLVSVRSPAVVSTGGFNDFTGRTEQYTYIGGTTSLKGFLTSIVRPNEAVSSTPYVQFAYETGSGGSGSYYGWVKSQILGGTIASMSAGGTITYQYFPELTSDPTNYLTISRLRTVVRDRRGLLSEYRFNGNGNALSIRRYKADDTAFKEHLYAYNSDGEVTQVTYPEGNFETRTYQPATNRWGAGNLTEVTQWPGPRGGDQTQRVRTFAYEPVFNHVISTQDERGVQTKFHFDWMEGSADSMDPEYVINKIALEMRLTVQDVINLGVPALLKNQDLNGDGRHADVRGNVAQREEPVVTLSSLGGGLQVALEGGVSQEANHSFTFNAYGQITSETDAEQNVSVSLYWPATDPDGDGLDAITGPDELTGGYLKRRIVDTQPPFSDPQLTGVLARILSTDIGRDSNQNPTPTNLTTDFFYDRVGNVTAVIDPRGVRTSYSVNELNEVWQIVRAATTSDASTRNGGCDSSQSENLSGQNFAYTEKRKYDANGNVIAVLVQNSGNLADQGSVPGFIETNRTFDILNNLRTESREFGQSGETATWTRDYDPGELLIRIVEPEGNKVEFAYEFRDLLESVTRGAGTPLLASTKTFVRDGNGNVIEEIKGWSGTTAKTLFHFDGFDRVKEIIAPVGSQTLYTYDPASNVVETLERGQDSGPSPTNNSTAGNVDLLRIQQAFDARSRLYLTDRSDPRSALVDGSLTASDGKVSTLQNLDRLGRRTSLVEDDSQAHVSRFDGAGRKIRAIDPAGNEVLGCFDDNGNLVKVTEIEKYPSGATKSYETYRVFDSLNRLASTTDNIGETHRFGYDSRGNRVSSSDAVALLTSETINGHTVNGPGNSRRFYHDGFSRLVKEELDLRVGGTGNGKIDLSNGFNADGAVILEQTWDRNSRLVTRKDDRGMVTTQGFDALNRMNLESFADGTSRSFQYDPDDNLTQVVDARGNQVALAFDGSNRLTAIDLAVTGTGVVGSKHQQFEYDGLGRRTLARDSIDATLDANDWIVTRTWDALSRIKTETQGGRTLTSTWREEGKRTGLSYPSAFSVAYSHDALDRISQFDTQGSMLAKYRYAGKRRVFDRELRNGTFELHHNGVGAGDDTNYWDGVRRPTRIDHVKSGVLQTGLAHAFDRAGNRLYEQRLHDSLKGDNYVYDSLYRLVTLERGVPASDLGYPGLGNEEFSKTWDLDGVHNWRRHTTISDVGQAVTNISVNNVNEYTAFGNPTPQHDLDGNYITANANANPPVTFQYDFQNRLRQITQGTKVVKHDYDAEGRRVRTTTTNVAGQPAKVEYVHDGWEVIEEWDANASTLMRRFTMGVKLDEPLLLENLAFYPGPGTYFYQQSTLGNVAALTNSVGDVVERYEYGAYGVPQFETPALVVKAVSASDFGNPYLFTGRRYDTAITKIYEFRNRFYNPNHGRFMQRDPIGCWTDRLNVGNPYAYVADNPTNGLDSLGQSFLGKAVVLGIKAGKAATKAVAKNLDRDDLVRLVKEDETVVAGSRNAAKDIAEKAGDGQRPIHEVDAATGEPHFHTGDRSGGHVLYSAAAALTVSHYAEGCGSLLEGAAFVADLFNPLSIFQDAIDIKSAIFGD